MLPVPVRLADWWQGEKNCLGTHSSPGLGRVFWQMNGSLGVLTFGEGRPIVSITTGPVLLFAVAAIEIKFGQYVAGLELAAPNVEREVDFCGCDLHERG